jgi:hypothetical protein
MMVWQAAERNEWDVAIRHADFAVELIGGFAFTRDVLSQLDAGGADRAIGRLREMLAGHLRSDGVWFGSRAWIVAARGG